MPLKVPDRLLRLREMVRQEATTVLLAEEAVEAPEAVGLGADVEQLNHQQVAGLGAFHAHRTRQIVHRGQVDVAHIVGAVVVLDESTSPVEGFENEVVTRLDPAGHRDVRVPAVVDVLVEGGGLAQVHLDQGVGHGWLLCGLWGAEEKRMKRR
jgi:hypothetical protein